MAQVIAHIPSFFLQPKVQLILRSGYSFYFLPHDSRATNGLLDLVRHSARPVDLGGEHESHNPVLSRVARTTVSSPAEEPNLDQFGFLFLYLFLLVYKYFIYCVYLVINLRNLLGVTE